MVWVLVGRDETRVLEVGRDEAHALGRDGTRVLRVGRDGACTQGVGREEARRLEVGRDGARGLGVGRDLLIRLEPSGKISVGANFFFWVFLISIPDNELRI